MASRPTFSREASERGVAARAAAMAGARSSSEARRQSCAKKTYETQVGLNAGHQFEAKKGRCASANVHQAMLCLRMRAL